MYIAHRFVGKFSLLQSKLSLPFALGFTTAYDFYRAPFTGTGTLKIPFLNIIFGVYFGFCFKQR